VSRTCRIPYADSSRNLRVCHADLLGQRGVWVAHPTIGNEETVTITHLPSGRALLRGMAHEESAAMLAALGVPALRRFAEAASWLSEPPATPALLAVVALYQDDAAPDGWASAPAADFRLPF